MKKFVLLLGILFAMQTALVAQLTDQEVVVFNAHLLSTFNLNVDGVVQEITFANAADYNLGVTEPLASGIDPGFSLISVEATGNWWLSINCPDFTGPDNIPINNLGVWCEATGGHQFGAEVTSLYPNLGASLGLSNPPAVPEIIGNGTGNAGDATDNAFTLHWRMGTQDNGTMHVGSMFDQMANGDFPIGDYTTTATLTLTEIP